MYGFNSRVWNNLNTISLAATIRSYREDLLVHLSKDVSKQKVIPKIPPSHYFAGNTKCAIQVLLLFSINKSSPLHPSADGNIPDVGELMAASFPPNVEIDFTKSEW